MWEKNSIGLAGLLLAFDAAALSADNPYQAILGRNVFALKPLTVQDETPATKEAPAKIIPAGLTTVVGRKVALFKVQFPPKPPQAAREESFILGEGERAGEIEVIRIDENEGTITFRNKGILIALNLEKDGAKPPNTPVAPPAGVPPPIANNLGGPMPLPVPGAPVYHTNSALRNLPARQFPAPPAPTPTPPQVPPQATQQKPLTPEEQIILMELERENTKGQVQNGSLPPLPPTPVAPQ